MSCLWYPDKIQGILGHNTGFVAGLIGMVSLEFASLDFFVVAHYNEHMLIIWSK